MHSSDAKTETPKAGGFLTGEWSVIPSRNLLARGEVEVRVEPRVMDVLVHLAGRAGEVVSKEELAERVWEGRYVTDDVLTVTIYALRKALGDDARRPRYLETVSRRGYRWIAPATQMPAASPAQPSGDAPAALPSGGSGPTARGASWRTAARAAALLLFALGAAWILTPARHGRHVPTAESREAYVKGRFFLDQRSSKSWQQSLEQFERAVTLDPKSPAAQAGLADTYSAMSDFGVAPPSEMRPKAMKAAQRALELDPQSAEGLSALGRAQFLFDWDFAGAERSLTRALALDADYMPAYQTLAWLMSARGQASEAIAAARRALQLDPVNPARSNELCWVLDLGGRYDEALRESDRAIQVNPRAFEIHLMKGWTNELAGHPAEAFAAYREGMRLSGAPEDAVQRAEADYKAGGLSGFYRGWLERQSRSGRTPMSETARAKANARLGETETALEALQKAFEKRESALAWINVEPAFQSLRSDPRFQRVAARVGAGAGVH